MNDKDLVEITSVYEIAEILREDIQKVAQDVKDQMFNENHKERADIPETKVNIMIVYRHLEDAIMRLGKVIQAQDSGDYVVPVGRGAK